MGLSQLITRSPRADFIGPKEAPRAGEPLSEYLFVRSGWFKGGGRVQTSTLVVPRQVMHDVPFDGALPRYQETDWILRAAHAGGAPDHDHGAAIDLVRRGGTQRHHPVVCRRLAIRARVGSRAPAPDDAARVRVARVRPRRWPRCDVARRPRALGGLARGPAQRTAVRPGHRHWSSGSGSCPAAFVGTCEPGSPAALSSAYRLTMVGRGRNGLDPLTTAPGIHSGASSASSSGSRKSSIVHSSSRELTGTLVAEVVEVVVPRRRPTSRRTSERGRTARRWPARAARSPSQKSASRPGCTSSIRASMGGVSGMATGTTMDPFASAVSTSQRQDDSTSAGRPTRRSVEVDRIESCSSISAIVLPRPMMNPSGRSRRPLSSRTADGSGSAMASRMSRGWPRHRQTIETWLP